MTATMHADSIVIGNRIEELRRMSRWLQDESAAAGIAENLLMKLDLCANEAVMNIISYAYVDANPHDITLELRRTEDGARLVIRDDGKPFNPLETPEHQAPESIENARIGGLGVHLIRRLMARCDYQREGRFNVLCLEARLDPPAAHA